MINAPVKKSKLIQVEGMTKKKKKKKKSIGQKNDISFKEVTKSITSDRIERRKKIHVADTD